MQLVLSLFPGLGLLDRAFELEGFTVVRGPDKLFGGDVREFTPPPGRFDGIIGGPPCQKFSEAIGINNGRMVRAPENLIPEFERVVSACRPAWFVMENVRRAPLPIVSGYTVSEYLLNCRWFGSPQKRIRRFSFGCAGSVRRPLLVEPTLSRAQTIVRTVLASDGKRAGKGGCRRGRQNTLERQVHTFGQACEYQGVPQEMRVALNESGVYTKYGRWLLVGNGVPLPMGRAVAKAVREALVGWSPPPGG